MLFKKGNKIGHRFQKGHKIRNTGRTRFQKGNKFGCLNKGEKYNFTPARRKTLLENSKKRKCIEKPIGTKRIRKDDGYIEIKVRRGSKGWMREHRFIMEQYLKRKLKNEIIHHINGNRTDNRIINLMVLPKKKHNNLYSICCPKCKNIIQL